MQAEDIKALIATGLTDVRIEIDGDGTHFQATIVSDQFEGKSMLQRHQLVYKALGEKMGTDIHALSMQTFTTSEWDERKNLSLLK
ncbi:MAG: BolA/IbaG family iron-sulfur metabolism protein [Gammaproteobacteria bacterium]|nr:BolA/IbaG family iron-sulfur metabolism protein [Gammaproteobacteria bacterium]NIN62827.1 BolA/IbaG family iron-sulfur metabolism protein [Gammaproteobacteria bacterium]NIO63808.1 BolA/IbaG family iron-sulfur metabolism protein [Gammaproteobacteria bacterium]NIP50186.1 BolA/IbaG family iron-sulfur metabolism protein [Gammaproteobacteria bacterium]NIQ12404.1 BolA/IbaG family iron-sulfur metabolism protein [Gammaproteobacteria bacterium]